MNRPVVTIVLADDHQLIRQGLRALLETEPDFRIVGEASDGLEAVRVVERLQPHILVVDLMMPALNGMEVTREVVQRVPNTRVVVLSIHSGEGYVLEALRNGAYGYVLKESSVEDLVKAVRAAASGRRYLGAGLTDRAVERYVEKAREAPSDPYDSLTTREREVFQLAAEGYTNAEIAARLSISPRTAETHRANLIRKLGLRSHTELVRYAVRRGILPLEN
jgi:two-component system, NarL family, response regulator NreC